MKHVLQYQESCIISENKQLLLTTKKTTKLRNAIESNLSTDLKLSKGQISKIIQSGEFLGKLLGSLLKIGLPLIKNVIKPLAKSVLIPLGLTAQHLLLILEYKKKILGSGRKTLIISKYVSNKYLVFQVCY